MVVMREGVTCEWVVVCVSVQGSCVSMSVVWGTVCECESALA